MPFTAAHAVAALPFRRAHLNTGALVIGCLSPDFEYFLRLAARGSAGHTPAGLVWFDLPLSFVVLVLWHRYVAASLVTVAPGVFPPGSLQGEQNPLGTNLRQFALACVSILIGAGTHLLWDSFTHPVFWPYRHLPVLSRSIRFGTGVHLPVYKLLQHASTLLGLAILLTLGLRWRLRQPSRGWQSLRPAAWCMLAVAFAAAGARVLVPVALHRPLPGVGLIASSFTVTWISALWLALVAFGVWGKIARGRTRATFPAA